MQKLFTCFALILLLSGCGARAAQDVPPAVPDSFSCRVRISAPQETLECSWTMTHGDSDFEILSPPTLRGMHVLLSEDASQIRLDDVCAALTDGACFVRIENAYRTLLTSPVTPVQTAQGWLYDDRAAHGFALVQDAQTGLPLRISIPAHEITAVLSDAAVTETETHA